jgi:Galactose oxidase, central domain
VFKLSAAEHALPLQGTEDGKSRRDARDDELKSSNVEDPLDLRVVLFGGESGNGCYLNDVYELEMRTLQWQQLSPLKGSRYLRCHLQAYEDDDDDDDVNDD